MCHSMQIALKILNSVADTGLNPRKPKDREKRSSLIRGLFMNKYERAKHAKEAEKLAEESCL